MAGASAIIDDDISDNDSAVSYNADISDNSASSSDSSCSSMRFDYLSSDEDEPADTICHDWYKMDSGPNSYDPVIPRFPFTGSPGIKVPITTEMEPLDFLNLIFDESIMHTICRETNRYANQNTINRWTDTSIDELRLLLALHIHQGVVKLPREVMHWSRDPLFDMSFSRNVMSYRRYRLLKQGLHFSDNEKYDRATHPNPKLNKIYSVYCKIQKKFRTLYIPERDVAIDESLMGYKEKLGWVQYIPLKRARFGIKHFMLCESSTGYVCDFIIYVGKGTQFDPAYDHLDNRSARVVMSLMKPLLQKGYCVTTDNDYTSPNLCALLIRERTDTFGTVRMNRKDMPLSLKNAVVKKGEVLAYRKGKTMALRWKDKKDVNLLSTIHNAESRTVETGKGPVIKPVVVCDYNFTMGGVDRADQHLSDYQIPRKRTKKYYKKIFFHLFDLAVWNSYLLYKAAGRPAVSPLEFRLMIVRQSVERYRPGMSHSRSGRPSPHRNPSRYNGGHFLMELPPTANKKAPTRRCIVCSKRDVDGNFKRKESRYQCKICKQSMCLIPCFEKYHTK